MGGGQKQFPGKYPNQNLSGTIPVSLQALPSLLSGVHPPAPHNLHPEFQSRPLDKATRKAFNSATTSHRCGDEFIFHPLGVCCLRSCWAGRLGSDRTTQRRGSGCCAGWLVHPEEGKRRLWFPPRAQAQENSQAVQRQCREALREREWGKARPPASWGASSASSRVRAKWLAIPSSREARG